MKTAITNNPILSFLGITFLITFSLWFLPVFVEIPRDVDFALSLLGSCGPLIAGYVITVIRSGATFRIASKPLFFIIFVATWIVFLLFLWMRGDATGGQGTIPTIDQVGVFAYVLFFVVFFILALNVSNATNRKLKENYLRSFLFNRQQVKWYVLAFFIFIALNLLSYFVGDVAGYVTSDFLIRPKWTWLIGFFATFLFVGSNEEFGWRGFFQKELQKKYNPLISALIISFFWSLWHLPLYYNGVYTTEGFMLSLSRFAWTLPLTIVFTWFYNKSNYSILVVVILHAAFNNASIIAGRSTTFYLILGVLFAVFCIIDGKMWKKQSYDHLYHDSSPENDVA